MLFGKRLVHSVTYLVGSQRVSSAQRLAVAISALEVVLCSHLGEVVL